MKRSFVILNVPEKVPLSQLQCRLQNITAQSVDVYDSNFVDKEGVYGLKRVEPATVVQVQLIEERQNVSAIVAVVNASGLLIPHAFARIGHGESVLDRTLQFIDNKLISKIDGILTKLDTYKHALDNYGSDIDGSPDGDDDQDDCPIIAFMEENVHSLCDDDISLLVDYFDQLKAVGMDESVLDTEEAELTSPPSLSLFIASMTTSTKTLKLADVRQNLKNGWRTVCTVLYVDPVLSMSLNGKDQYGIRIADETGQSCFVFYGSQAKKAFGMLRVGMVVDFSNPLVIVNNPKYNVAHSMYYLQDNMRSGKWKVFPDYEISYPMPTLAYKCTTIDALSTCNDIAVDVVVCVKSSNDYVNAGDSGYRLLVVYDATSVIDLKIWGPLGAQFPYTEPGSILGIKDAKTSLWENVVSLSTTKFTTVVLSPEVGEADRLRAIVHSEDFSDEKLQTVSSTRNKFQNTPVVSIEKGLDLARKSEKSVYIVIEGSIDSLSPNPEHVIYPACPHCKTKIGLNGRCAKDSCKDKIMAVYYGKRLKLEVSHKGVDCEVTAWADSVAELFDVTGFDLVSTFNDNSSKFNAMYDDLIGQKKMFAIQARSVYKEGNLDVVFNLMGSMTKSEYDREFTSTSVVDHNVATPTVATPAAASGVVSDRPTTVKTVTPTTEESELQSGSSSLHAIGLPPSAADSFNTLFGDDSVYSPADLNVDATLGDGEPDSDGGSDTELFSRNFPLPAHSAASDVTPATRKSTRLKNSSGIPSKVRKTLPMP